MPVGLLRHSGSIWSGLSGSEYPLDDLDVIVYNQTYEDGGTTYYKTSTGVGLDVIGQDTDGEDIINFAPLNDNRFDKGSYTGNSFSLPEYYDFPYVNIYYDDTDADTRKYWKLKDFHYANILAQSLLLDNQFFLKAKATTETSNEISEIYQLNIYDSEQTGAALTKLKTWMRVQTFESDELLDNGDFEGVFLGGIADSFTQFINGTPSEENTIVKSGSKSQKFSLSSEAGGIYQDVPALQNVPILITGSVYGTNVITVTGVFLRKTDLSFLEIIQVINVANEWITYETLYTPNSDFTLRIVVAESRNAQTTILYADDVSAKYYYENYYKP